MLRSRFCCVFLFFSLCVAVQATDVSGTVAVDTTWGLAGSPYVMQGDVSINAGVTLTLQAGVEVIAAGDYRIFVNGTLNATGTVAKPVVLRASDSAARGVWQGLYVPPGGHCLLRWTTLHNAVYDILAPGGEVVLADCEVGKASEHGLYAWNAARLIVVRCEFADNGSRGIYIEGYQATGAIKDCKFSRNGDYPLFVKATVAKIIGGGNYYKENGVQRIGVSCSMVDDLTGLNSWTRQPVSFEVGAGTGDQVLKILRGASLNLPAGTVVVADAIDCYGVLRVAGTAGSPVVFEGPGEAPVAGAWEGLVVRTGAKADLRFVEFRHARAAVTVDDPQSLVVEDCSFSDSEFDGLTVMGAGAVKVQRCLFARNGRNGLRLAGTALTGQVGACTFVQNGSYPLWALARNMRMVGSRNWYSNNGLQSLGLSCDLGTDLLDGVHDWYSQRVPLDLTAGVAEAILTVGAAATLNVYGEQTIRSGGVVVGGKLYVAGDAAKPCRFVGNAGWNGISFDGGAGELRGAVVEGATTGVTLTNASPLLYECSLQHNQLDGLRCRGTSSPVVGDSLIANNGRYGVYIEGTAAPNLGCLDNASTDDDGGNYLHSNGQYEIYNTTSGPIKAERNAWGSQEVAGINARIFDHSDLSSYGVVDFSPVWTAGPNRAPVLSWPDTVGYSDNGLSPELVAVGKTVEFRVRYADVEGQAPAFVRVHVAREGKEIDGSPLLMKKIDGAGYAAGAVYAAKWALAAGSGYTYWFAASDGRDLATGQPTAVQTGLRVSSRPRLTWAGTTGYTFDGVSPDSGAVGANFGFRVKYVDADNEAPERIVCHILLGETPITGSPFAMAAISGTDFVSGKVYRVTRTLSAAGTYSYRFEATDGVLKATDWVATLRTGPTVGTVGAGLISAGAEEVRQGLVRVAWRQGTAGRVRVEVVNLAGRLVARLHEAGEHEAGEQAVLWAARGRGGQRVPPGRYLVRLQLDDAEGGRHTAVVGLLLR